jgi:hypothetical protein
MARLGLAALAYVGQRRAQLFEQPLVGFGVGPIIVGADVEQRFDDRHMILIRKESTTNEYKNREPEPWIPRTQYGRLYNWLLAHTVGVTRSPALHQGFRYRSPASQSQLRLTGV